MRYIFEKRPLMTDESQIDDREFPSDKAAIEHAFTIGADYVWDVCEDEYIPRTVWSRPQVSPALHKAIETRLNAWIKTLKFSKPRVVKRWN